MSASRKLGASKGGFARSRGMTAERRRAISEAGAAARWGHNGLSGDPLATMPFAQEILNVARVEAKGQGPGLRSRQAAEKVWLAVTTAADALVGPVSSAADVRGAFKRAWGEEGAKLVEDVNVALHHGCFYGNSPFCNGRQIEPWIIKVGRLLHRPVRDRGIARRLAQQGWVSHEGSRG